MGNATLKTTCLALVSSVDPALVNAACSARFQIVDDPGQPRDSLGSGLIQAIVGTQLTYSFVKSSTTNSSQSQVLYFDGSNSSSCTVQPGLKLLSVQKREEQKEVKDYKSTALSSVTVTDDFQGGQYLEHNGGPNPGIDGPVKIVYDGDGVTPKSLSVQILQTHIPTSGVDEKDVFDYHYALTFHENVDMPLAETTSFEFVVSIYGSQAKLDANVCHYYLKQQRYWIRGQTETVLQNIWSAIALLNSQSGQAFLFASDKYERTKSIDFIGPFSTLANIALLSGTNSHPRYQREFWRDTELKNLDAGPNANRCYGSAGYWNLIIQSKTPVVKRMCIVTLFENECMNVDQTKLPSQTREYTIPESQGDKTIVFDTSLFGNSNCQGYVMQIEGYRLAEDYSASTLSYKLLTEEQKTFLNENVSLNSGLTTLKINWGTMLMLSFKNQLEILISIRPSAYDYEINRKVFKVAFQMKSNCVSALDIATLTNLLESLKSVARAAPGATATRTSKDLSTALNSSSGTCSQNNAPKFSKIQLKKITNASGTDVDLSAEGYDTSQVALGSQTNPKSSKYPLWINQANNYIEIVLTDQDLVGTYAYEFIIDEFGAKAGAKQVKYSFTIAVTAPTSSDLEFVSGLTEQILVSGRTYSWTLPETQSKSGTQTLQEIKATIPASISDVLSFQSSTRQLTYNGSLFSNSLSSTSISISFVLVATSGVSSSAVTQTLKLEPQECGVAQTHTGYADTTETPVTLIVEWQQTVYFPALLFNGPQSYNGFACKGFTYTQTITMDQPINGVSVTVPEQPTTNSRPYLSINNDSPKSGEFTLSFKAEAKYGAHDFKDEFTQKYLLKSVFSTDYIAQPTVTTTSDLTFDIAAAAPDATPPKQTLDVSKLAVTYPFKSDTADPLGNTPPLIVPIPYSGFASGQIVKGQSSLGATSLTTPTGVLKIQQDTSSDLGQNEFRCDAWTTAKAGTSVTKTLSLVNSVVDSFKSTVDVKCVYQTLTKPSFSATLPAVVLTSGVSSSWTLPSVTDGYFSPTTISFSPPSTLQSFLTFDATTRTVTYNGGAYDASLSSAKVSISLVDSQGNASPFDQSLSLQPVACGAALTHAFQTAQNIAVVVEYQPTIYFPEVIFAGPHTHTAYSCGGTYTQSITVASAVTGVVLTASPTGSDKRPSLAFSAGAVAGSTVTLTITGEYVHTPSSVSRKVSVAQTYQLKSVFTTDYIAQPTVTTTSDLTFDIAAAAPDATPPKQTLDVSKLAVTYPFKSDTADPLGNTPPLIVPIPYSGFASGQIVKGQSSLGATSLTSPTGVLKIQQDTSSDLGQNEFRCDAWTTAKAGTSVTKTLSLVNSVVDSFKSTVDVKCVYQTLTKPSFSATLPAVVLTSGVSSSWTLPSVTDGYFSPTTISFSPPSTLQSFLTFDATTRTVTYNGGAYDASLSSAKVSISLVDSQGNASPFDQSLSLQPVACGAALTHAFQTAQNIAVVVEYQPTIYFPEVIFAGPHTHTAYSCGGTYTQSITVASAVTGVVLTASPTGSDKRPSLAFSAGAVAGSTVTLTITGEYVHTPSSVSRKVSVAQTYQLKSVFTTDYIAQPTVTTTSDLTFDIAAAAPDATPPKQTLDVSKLAVTYPFKSDTADPLGNTPPLIVPIPYSGFASGQIVKGQSSLGATSLTSPTGVLKIQQDTSSDLGQNEFRCDAWTTAKAGTSVTKTLSLVNSVVDSFKSTVDVKCVYQTLTKPSFSATLPAVVLTSGVSSSWTLPSVTDGYFSPTTISFSPPSTLQSFLTFDATTRTVTYNGGAYDASLSSAKVSISLVDSQGNASPFDQSLSLQPVACGAALTHAFQTAQNIAVVVEYQPTIYFPEVIFAGPHTHTAYSCGGTYTQSITVASAVTGVVLTTSPTGSDKRPSLAFGAGAVAGSTVTLTITGEYVHTPSSVSRKVSVAQTYQLKSVFTTDYIAQPTVTTTSDLTFDIAAAAPDATPPKQTLDVSKLAVTYPFKSDTADPLGNTPPLIVPIPYSGFASGQIVKGQSSLGATSLTSPTGVLKIQQDTSSDLGQNEFRCDAWTTAKAGTSVTKTLSLVNSVVDSFKSTVDVKCVYQTLTKPSFSATLPAVVLTSGVSSSWTLPSVTDGYFSPTTISFSPPSTLQSFLTFDATTRTVTYNGGAYDASLSSAKVSISLVDSQGNASPFDQSLSLQPTECAGNLTKIVDTQSKVSVLMDYQPSIFYPKQLYGGPHTFAGFKCQGTYSQSISIRSEAPGISVINSPGSNSDSRLRVDIGASALAGTEFILTLGAKFQGVGFTRTGEFSQTIQLKSVFSTEYLEQPLLSSSLSPRELTFSVDKPKDGGAVDTQILESKLFNVTYMFKQQADQFGNNPPVFSQSPFAGFSSGDFTLNKKIGTTSLENPQGTLKAANFKGDLDPSSTMEFECPAWSKEAVNTTVTKTLKFVNSVEPLFTTALNVSCSYNEDRSEKLLFEDTVRRINANFAKILTIESQSVETKIQLDQVTSLFGSGLYVSYELSLEQTIPLKLKELVKVSLKDSTMTIAPLNELFTEKFASLSIKVSDGQGRSSQLKVELELSSLKTKVESAAESVSAAEAKDLQKKSEKEDTKVAPPTGDNQDPVSEKKPVVSPSKGDQANEKSTEQKQEATKVETPKPVEDLGLDPSLADVKVVTADELARADPSELLSSVAELKDAKISPEDLTSANVIAELFANQLVSLSDDRKQAALGGIMQARFAELKRQEARTANDASPPPKPELTFKPVLPSAKLTMVFSQQMAGMSILKQVGTMEVKGKGTVSSRLAGDVLKLQTTPAKNKPRLLAAEKKQSGFNLSQYIVFELLRGDEDSAPASALGFEVLVQGFEGDDLNFKMKFENPVAVSTGSKPDMIIGTIVDEAFFSSENSPQSVKVGTQIFSVLPRLLPGEAIEDILAATEQLTESAASTFMTSQLIITLVLSVSLKQMWNLFCVMQVLAYAQNFIMWPAVAQMVITQIIDAIYLKKVNDMIMEFGMSKYEAAKSATKDKFKLEQGIADDSLMKALGVFFIGIIGVAFVLALYLCVRSCKGKQFCLKIRDMIQRKLFYSGPIRYVVVGYLKLFNQFLTTLAMTLDAGQAIAAAYFVPIILLALFPSWVVWHLHTNNHKLNDEQFKQKFGSLYAGIRTDSFKALCHTAIFCMRRIDIVLINVYFSEGSPLSGIDRSMYLQKILCFLFIQMGYLAFIHNAHPHDDSLFNKLEFINEYSMMGIAYCMINFANVVSIQDQFTREPVDSDNTLNNVVEGLAIALICLIVAVNFGTMALMSIKKLCNWMKRRKALKAHKAAIEERLKAKEKTLTLSSKKMLTEIQEVEQEEDADSGLPRSVPPYQCSSPVVVDLSSQKAVVINEKQSENDEVLEARFSALLTKPSSQQTMSVQKPKNRPPLPAENPGRHSKSVLKPSGHQQSNAGTEINHKVTFNNVVSVQAGKDGRALTEQEQKLLRTVKLAINKKALVCDIAKLNRIVEK